MAGTYDVTAIFNGCTSSAGTTSVTINTIPISAGIITGTSPVCLGQNSVTYTIPTITNATTYIWSLPSGAIGTSSTNSISVSYSDTAVSGSISVYGHNSCGDGTASNLSVTVVPKPKANAGNDTTICPGSSIILKATGGGTYTWNNGVTQGVAFVPTSTKTYTVTVSNGFCTATDSVKVTIATPPSAPVIYLIGSVLNSTASTGNQWFFNNTIIPGATSQTYTPTSTGNYYCVVSDAYGCLSDSSNNIYIDITGINNLSNNKDINIFPNPVNDNLQIQSVLQIKSIDVLDITGRLLYTTTSKTINCSSFAKGVYFITLTTEEGKAVKKFVKE